VRLVIARCSVDYAGRLSAHLPLATRLLMVKRDGSLLVHSDGGSYKPLNWMSPPCTVRVVEPDDDQREAGVTELWKVTQPKTADVLVVSIHEVLHDSSHEMGVDPGLTKDGVEADLQKLLAEQIELLGEGHTLVRREYMTAIGPVDILARDASGGAVAVELKRRGDRRLRGAGDQAPGPHARPRPGHPDAAARLRRHARAGRLALAAVLSGRAPLVAPGCEM
jgi:RecB family endonuclease NucS